MLRSLRCDKHEFCLVVIKFNKTDIKLVTSKRAKHFRNLPTSITIGNAQIPFMQSVKILCFTLDCHLTVNAHVSKIARTCCLELRRLASIRRFLTITVTATLVSAFDKIVVCCCFLSFYLSYCNVGMLFNLWPHAYFFT